MRASYASKREKPHTVVTATNPAIAAVAATLRANPARVSTTNGVNQ